MHGWVRIFVSQAVGGLNEESCLGKIFIAMSLLYVFKAVCAKLYIIVNDFYFQLRAVGQRFYELTYSMQLQN